MRLSTFPKCWILESLLGFPFWSGRLWFRSIKHAFLLGTYADVKPFPTLSPGGYSRVDPALQVLRDTWLWSVNEGIASSLARNLGSREGRWLKPVCPSHGDSISRLLLELMDNRDFFQTRVAKQMRHKPSTRWRPPGENLLKYNPTARKAEPRGEERLIPDNTRAPGGSHSWGVYSLNFSDAWTVYLLLFKLGRVGFLLFVPKSVLTNPPSIKAEEKLLLQYFSQIEEGMVTQLTMKWWPV